MATLTAEDGGNVMIKEAIIKLSKKEDLSYEMAQTVMDEIMTGEADDIQKSADVYKRQCFVLQMQESM